MEMQTSEIGINRTGLQASPQNAQELLSATKTVLPSTPGDASGIGKVRAEYIAESDPLGSVPPPAAATGVLKGGVNIEAQNQSQLFADKLGERLAFERTGTRLYEALIVKFRAYESELSNVSLARIEEIRDEEAEHFSVLRAAIESLGGDPTVQTPAADITAVESQGLMQVLTDPRTTFTQSLHAILVAELTDVDGWDTLIRLARAAGHEHLAVEFESAQEAEETHLDSVRQWLIDLMEGETTVLS
jgi:rubrerythrin